MSKFHFSSLTSLLPLIVLLPVVLFGVSLLAGCERSPQDPPAETPAAASALTVAVEPVAQETVRRSIAATGSVAAWEEMTVSAQVSGIAVVEVLVAEGDRVEQGQLLARLDDSLLTAEIAEQQAAIDEAQANLTLAESAEARGQTLVKSSTISKETQEERSAATKTGAAKLRQAQALLTLLEAQLAQTLIVAPAAGSVSEKPVPLGSVVQVGTELFHIVRDSRLEVQARIPEQYLSQIQPGQAVAVTASDGGVTDAAVRGVAEKVDADTRLGIVYVALPVDTTLKPGMFARVAIAAGESETLTVPEAALVWRDGLAKVFALQDDDSVAERAVTTGARQKGRVEITAGLEAGERIVIAGAGFLGDGDRVQVSQQEAAAATQEPAR